MDTNQRQHRCVNCGAVLDLLTLSSVCDTCGQRAFIERLHHLANTRDVIDVEELDQLIDFLVDQRNIEEPLEELVGRLVI